MYDEVFSYTIKGKNNLIQIYYFNREDRIFDQDIIPWSSVERITKSPYMKEHDLLLRTKYDYNKAYHSKDKIITKYVKYDKDTVEQITKLYKTI